VAAGTAVAIFGLLVFVLPAFSLTYDEAKYLSMGANIWSGHGPVTAFGVPFLLHAPLWMTLVYASKPLAGVDPVTWAHILDGACGMGVVALAAVMGRRSSPAAGIVAAFAMLGFSYLLQLSRTTRLDVPVAFVTLLYLEVGWRAVRSGSIRWAVAAGATLAGAVWIKEVPIPLAPVPILCGVLAGMPWPRLLRTTGWLVLAVTAGLAPWFAYFALETGTVYRLGTPAQTLPLVVAPLAVIVVVGLAADRLAASTVLVDRLLRVRRRLPAALVERGRPIIGWTTTFAWAAAFVAFFSRVARLGGASLFGLAQLRHTVVTWAFDLVPVGLFVASGFALALVLLASTAGGRERRTVTNALVASVCGAPLVLLVLAIGEPPRDFIAQVVTAVVVAAAAWAWAVGRLVAWGTRDGRRPAVARWGMTAFLALVLATGTLAAGGRAWITRAGSADAPSAATQTAVAWIRANVPPGTAIAFGAYLSFNIAGQLVPDYDTFQVQARLSGIDPSLPEGFRFSGEAGASDWVAVDIAPRLVNQYEAYRATWVAAELRRHRIAYWVYATGSPTAAPSILPQLTPDHGFERVAHWAWPTKGVPVEVSIFRVDPAAVALDPSHLYMSPAALRRIVTLVGANPVAWKAAATSLASRIIVVPETAAGAADLARLRSLAGLSSP
jgi:hypothetical protein